MPSLDQSDQREQLVFMSVPVVLGSNEQSFEELRVADYLKAYIATGKPPLPCPLLPTGDRERADLGLPPVFKPYVEVGPSALTPSAVFGPDSPNGTRSGDGRAQIIIDAGNLPAVQSFRETMVEGILATESFQSLASQLEFVHFSHEELRYYAYAKGLIYPPTSSPPPASQIHSAVTSRTTTSPTSATSAEDMQSMSAASPYSQHSVEELRLAYLQSGRELTSVEIFQFKPPIPMSTAATPTRPSLFASSSGYIFSHPPTRKKQEL